MRKSRSRDQDLLFYFQPIAYLFLFELSYPILSYPVLSRYPIY